tara:strand:+ start:1380 stop:1937 length:558 start_codon:yes stop_codon:yes gene_type:complete
MGNPSNSNLDLTTIKLNPVGTRQIVELKDFMKRAIWNDYKIIYHHSNGKKKIDSILHIIHNSGFYNGQKCSLKMIEYMTNNEFCPILRFIILMNTDTGTNTGINQTIKSINFDNNTNNVHIFLDVEIQDLTNDEMKHIIDQDFDCKKTFSDSAQMDYSENNSDFNHRKSTKDENNYDTTNFGSIW